MKTSKNGIALIKKWESLHDGDLKMIGLQPKMDPAKIWTEGYGRAMRDGKGNFLKGAGLKAYAYNHATIRTEAEADQALAEDIKPFELQVLRATRSRKKPLTQNQFDALVVHTYNTGGSATLFDLVSRQAPISDIGVWWTTRYITGQGSKIPLNGLIGRRKDEFNLYTKS